MIQVPIFGMDNNPDSLMARRRAFLTAYGYPPEDVWGRVDELTEVIGHVPSGVPTVTLPAWEASFNHPGRVLLTFYSTVTPYTRAWVKQEASAALAFATNMERSGLWTLAKINTSK